MQKKIISNLYLIFKSQTNHKGGMGMDFIQLFIRKRDKEIQKHKGKLDKIETIKKYWEEELTKKAEKLVGKQLDIVLTTGRKIRLKALKILKKDSSANVLFRIKCVGDIVVSIFPETKITVTQEKRRKNERKNN